MTKPKTDIKIKMNRNIKKVMKMTKALYQKKDNLPYKNKSTFKMCIITNY